MFFLTQSGMKSLWKEVLKEGQNRGLIAGANCLVIFMDDMAIACVPLVKEGEDPVQEKFEAVLRARAGLSNLLDQMFMMSTDLVKSLTKDKVFVFLLELYQGFVTLPSASKLLFAPEPAPENEFEPATGVLSKVSSLCAELKRCGVPAVVALNIQCLIYGPMVRMLSKRSCKFESKNSRKEELDPMRFAFRILMPKELGFLGGVSFSDKLNQTL